MTVLFYWFSLRTFTFGLAPCQCFRLHGVLLGTQKRGWTWLILCSPLACLEGLQRQAVFGLAEHSLAWRCSDWRFHQYWIVMNGSYIRSAHQWLQWQWSLKNLYEKLLEAGRALNKKEEEYACEMYIKVHLNPKHKLLKEHHTNPVQLPWPLSVTGNGRSPSTMTVVLCVSCFSFPRCLSELPSTPSIVVLHCPIISSSHCVCVKKLVPLLGQGAGMPGWKDPGKNTFEPLLSPWFDAVHLSVVEFFVRHSRRSITSDPSNNNVWASHPP